MAKAIASRSEIENIEPRPPSGVNWYVVHCKPRQDWRALEHLERQGFECYLPTFSSKMRDCGHSGDTQLSLFPGYLFIHLDAVEDNWYPIRSTRGVNQIVRANQRPVPVRDQIIDDIRMRLATGGVHRACFQPGEHVVIRDGVFSGIEAIFMANDGDKRVVLLLNILHSEQHLSFPESRVQRLA